MAKSLLSFWVRLEGRAEEAQEIFSGYLRSQSRVGISLSDAATKGRFREGNLFFGVRKC